MAWQRDKNHAHFWGEQHFPQGVPPTPDQEVPASSGTWETGPRGRAPCSAARSLRGKGQSPRGGPDAKPTPRPLLQGKPATRSAHACWFTATGTPEEESVSLAGGSMAVFLWPLSFPLLSEALISEWRLSPNASCQPSRLAENMTPLKIQPPAS